MEESNSLYGLSSYTTQSDGRSKRLGLKPLAIAGTALVAIAALYFIFSGPSPEKPDQTRVPASVGSSGIEVLSLPDGAEVVVDGRSVGLVTPTAIAPSSKNPFRLEIRKDGYRSVIYTIDPNTQKAPIQVRLEKISYANVDILVEPSTNIQIKINGKVLSATELPLFGYLIEANKPHTIEVKNLRNGKSTTRNIRLANDGFQELQFNLK